MKKHRITMTVVLEFEVKPEYYKDAKTDEERLACDLEALSDAPYIMLESENCQITFTGETIEDSNSL